MNITIITWDASFRESFHTVDIFRKQNFPKEQFEFIWVDFYQADKPELLDAFTDFDNGRVLSLKHPKSEKWHIAKCLNSALEKASGEIIVIPDGDIIVAPDFLKAVHEAIVADSNQVLYFRRWDETRDCSSPNSYDFDHLERNCKLLNPINYGGCIAAHRDALAKVGNYDEHPVFAGPGCIHMEMSLRLTNAGYPIRWHDMKIYHPYHEATGSTDKKTGIMEVIALQHKWLNPYSGLEQSWVLQKRKTRNAEYSGNSGEIPQYLQEMPTLEELRSSLKLQTWMRFYARKLLNRLRS